MWNIMSKHFFGIFLLLRADHLLAAGDGGYGVAADLALPGINFVILFSFLVYKLRKPLSEMFDKNSDDVKQLYRVAKERDREAQIRLDMYQEKVNNMENERTNIIRRREQEAKELERRQISETDALIKKMEQETENKIKFGEMQIEARLYRSIVEKVIAKTQQDIGKDAQSERRTTDFLLSRIM